MVLVSRQKHQLKPLMLNLTLGTNIIKHVCEHRVLGITIDEGSPTLITSVKR